jgi:hypothetical protein
LRFSIFAKISLGLGLLDFFDQLEKGLRRMNSKIGQNFSVQLDIQLMQSLDEAAVGKAIFFACGFDPDDPKTPEISLFGSPIPVRILERTFNSLLGCPVVVTSCSPIAFGQL